MQTPIALVKYLKSFFIHYERALIEAEERNYEKNFYAIDSTEISLNLRDFPWTLFRSTIGGIKIHLKYDINNNVPDYLFMTNANKHENYTLKDMQLITGDSAERSIEATVTTKHSENFVKKVSFSSQGSKKMQNIPFLKAD